MANSNDKKQSSSSIEKEKTQEISKEIIAKIVSSYEKLSEKFRDKAEKSAKHLKNAKSEIKRETYRRRFELYGDAATDLDGRVRLLKGEADNGAD